ncbi:MAG: hypothetical protein WA139_03735 [Candidatus Aenigmatarchaeota archaeon]
MEKNASEKALLKKIKSLEGSLEITNEYAKKLGAKVGSLEKQKKLFLEEERKKNENQRRIVLHGKEISLRDALIKNLSSEVGALKKRFSKISELEMISSDGCVPVIRMDDFDKDSILEKDKTFGINNSVVFFARVSGESRAALRMLITLQPKAVIADLDESAARMLNNADIPAIAAKNIRIRKYLDFWGADRKELETEIRKFRKVFQ